MYNCIQGCTNSPVCSGKPTQRVNLWRRGAEWMQADCDTTAKVSRPSVDQARGPYDSQGSRRLLERPTGRALSLPRPLSDKSPAAIESTPPNAAVRWSIIGKQVHDIVIIGGGIAGTALAYFLAKEGQDVCIVERGIIGGEGSGRNGGGVRQNRRPALELPLAMRSVQLWKTLAEKSELDFEYNRHGNLSLVWNETAATEAKALVKRQRDQGLECYYLDRAETRSLIPHVVDRYCGGVYSPSCGSAEPYIACVAIARMASQLGVTIYEHREVTGIEIVYGRVSAVLTNSGPIATGVIVNSAGPWAPEIAHMVGVRLPIRLCRSHLLVTEPLPPVLEPFTSTGGYGYFRQTRSGNVHIGFGSLPVPDFGHRMVTYGALTVAATRTATIIPCLRNVSVIRAFTGFTAWTPDQAPIMGAVKDPTGFFIAAEFNATGFAMGPVIGELMAELILEGRTSLPIDAFSVARFGEPHDETA
jgi:sarcosine oxidase subunit beta